MGTKAHQVILGFDFGTRRIGVAVGQTITQTARPLQMIPAKEGNPDWNIIKKIIQTWQPDALVIGIPLNMDGTEQAITLLAREFSKQLAERFDLPIYEMDERLTSVAAREQIFDAGGYKALKSTSVDSVAAQLILQNWLAQYKIG